MIMARRIAMRPHHPLCSKARPGDRTAGATDAAANGASACRWRRPIWAAFTGQLAVAAGVPAVAVFGPSDETLKAARGPASPFAAAHR